MTSLLTTEECRDIYNAAMEAPDRSAVSVTRAIEAAVIRKLAAGVSVEPASMQFQTPTGAWCDFINDKHRDDTIADGTWPIRSLYTATALAATRVAALEEAAKVCEAHAHGWQENPGQNPHAGYIATSNCAVDIRALLGKEQSIPSWREQCSETTTLGAQLVLMQAEIDALRTALQPQAAEGCGEAGCAEGRCGTTECLPSFKAKKATAERASDLRGIDAGPLSEWTDLIRHGYVKKDECLIAVKDIPKWVGQNTPPATQAALTAALDYLWVVVEHNRLHFGDSHNTVIQGKAAIAQIVALGVKHGGI